MADHPFSGTLSVTDKIGIGIEEPIAQLHIASSTPAPSQTFLESGGALLKLSVDASGAAIGTDNAFPLSIKTDDISRISIDKIGNISLSGALSVQKSLTISGNVGIGTTSPSYKLAIAAGDINIDDGRALRQAGRWVIGGDSKVLSIGSSNAPDGRDIRFDPGFSGALTVKKDTGYVGIGTANPTEKLHVNGGGIKVGATTIATLGIEVVREVLPLSLATDSSFIDINGGWTPVTRTIYSVYSTTTPLPGSERKYKLVIRNGNNGIAQNGHISRYRLFFSWANQPDNKEYEGNLYWGDVNEGGWDTITLDHLANPSGQKSYWRLEGYTSGCTNRIFNVTIQVVDVIQ